MAERMKYWQDQTCKLKKVFDRVMTKHFKELLDANFLYVFRNKEKYDEEGRVIIAESRKIGAKERDIYLFDFEICVHADTWQSARIDEQMRIAFHELNHCRVEVDEDGHAKRDGDDRLKSKIEPHDVFLKSFRKEIELFGFTKEDEEQVEFLAEMLKGASSSKKKKQFVDDLDNVKPSSKKKEKVKLKKSDVKQGKKDLKEFKVSRDLKYEDAKKPAKKIEKKSDKKPFKKSGNKSSRSHLYLD